MEAFNPSPDCINSTNPYSLSGERTIDARNMEKQRKETILQLVMATLPEIFSIQFKYFTFFFGYSYSLLMKNNDK